MNGNMNMHTERDMDMERNYDVNMDTDMGTGDRAWASEMGESMQVRQPTHVDTLSSIFSSMPKKKQATVIGFRLISCSRSIVKLSFYNWHAARISFPTGARSNVIFFLY
jgi:hypothetical protein